MRTQGEPVKLVGHIQVVLTNADGQETVVYDGHNDIQLGVREFLAGCMDNTWGGVADKAIEQFFPDAGENYSSGGYDGIMCYGDDKSATTHYYSTLTTEEAAANGSTGRKWKGVLENTADPAETYYVDAFRLGAGWVSTAFGTPYSEWVLDTPLEMTLGDKLTINWELYVQ